MVNKFARVFGLWCLATLAGASPASESIHRSLALNEGRVPSSVRETAVRDGSDGEGLSTETAQMALFGAGLSYLGLRLRKRAA